MSMQSVDMRICDFINLHPGTITSISSIPSSERLFVTRQHYSEIDYVSVHNHSITVQQLTEMEPCLQMVSIDDCLLMFQQFQVKACVDGRWEYHSFTTQLLGIRRQGNSVYSFHQRENMLWAIEDGRLSYQYLSPAQTPYHLDHQCTLNGYGKKVTNIGKHPLTVCEVIEGEWVLVGDQGGRLHVLDWKFCTPVSTFHQHAAPILAIKVDPKTKTVYFSGSDSKICMIRLVGEEWRLGASIRGQSHDVLALQLIDGYLISGGVSTDLCFYPLQQGEFTGQFTHKVSYCGVNKVVSQGKFIVVNHRNRFQVWLAGQNEVRTQLVVEYQMPESKYIIDVRLFKEPIEEGIFLLLVFTDEDTVGWKLNIEEGLTKFITIQNQYILAEVTTNHDFVGVRSDGFVERVSCLTGKIEQGCSCEVELPTHFKLLGKGLALIASNLSQSAHVISLKRKETVNILKLPLPSPFDYLDLINSEILIHHVNQPVLFSVDPLSNQIEQIATLPIGIIRFGGWLSTVSKQHEALKAPKKKYWWGVSEGKVLVVTGLGRKGPCKIRVKQTHRIAQVVRPSGKSIGCNLGLIPYNFQKMVQEMPIQPVFTKKIQ